MDSDSLIKITKAGLKETVCEAWEVTIPRSVQHECVKAARARPDAARIRKNIEATRLTVAPTSAARGKGEDAVLRLFETGAYDAVSSDDARFIRRLRALGIPFAVPGVMIARLREQKAISPGAANEALERLRPMISPEEYAAAALMLTGGKAS
ncbi:MAG: hypothetical protein JXR37_03725 [Kiritimatiellae bacterium]|nr:hypothetical protein [Kiritimatiellia bacterium]